MSVQQATTGIGFGGQPSAGALSSRTEETANRRAQLRRRIHAIAKVAWVVLAITTATLFLLSLPVRFVQLQNLEIAGRSSADIMRAVDADTVRAALAETGLSPSLYAWYNLIGEIFYGLVFFVIALIIFRRRADQPVALYLSMTLILFGTASTPTMFVLAQGQPFIDGLVRLLNIAGWVCIYVFFYVFPNGVIVPRWMRWVITAFVLWEIAFTLFPNAWFSPWLWTAWLPLLIWGLYFGGGIAAQVYRHLRISNAIERAQTKWVLYGMAIAVAGGILAALPNVLYKSGVLTQSPGAIYELVRLPVQYAAILAFPISLGIAIIRANLYNIDLIITRTLVYVPLTGILAGLYAAVISLLQRTFMAVTGEKSDAAIVLTTLVLASTITPIKNALQAFVDKRFKEVPDTTKRLRELGKEMGKEFWVIDAHKLTRRLLNEAVASYGAETGAVYLCKNCRLTLTHTSGEWSGAQAQLSFPLRRADGTVLGMIELGRRKNGEEYTEQERETLAAVAKAAAEDMR